MQKGFTLLELLISLVIIAILVVIVFVALNPLEQAKDNRDATRYADISHLLEAIKLNQIDNQGKYLETLEKLTNGQYYLIGTCVDNGSINCSGQTTQPSCVDLSELTTKGYLPAIPTDPSNGNTLMTNYYVMKTDSGKITLGACYPENASSISLAR